MGDPVTSSASIQADRAVKLLAPLTDLVIKAGEAILAVSRRSLQVKGKADGSPVTEADLAADRIISEGLTAIDPALPVVSEERAEQSRPPFSGSFFLIDPLDGTKEFIAGRGEFTVNLALVSGGVPLLGIVSAPAIGLLWRGVVGWAPSAWRLTAPPWRRPRRSAPGPFQSRANPGTWRSAVPTVIRRPRPSSLPGPVRCE